MLMNFESKFDPYGAMSTPLYQTATFKQAMLKIFYPFHVPNDQEKQILPHECMIGLGLKNISKGCFLFIMINFVRK